jgi:porin
VIDQQIAAGFFYGGLLADRPADVLGVGVARTRLGLGANGAEYAIETYYDFKPYPWLSASPNLQFVDHPGGVTSRGPIIVFGLKASLKL